VSQNPSQAHPLVRKLESVLELSAAEREAIEALPLAPRTLKADQDIVRAYDQPAQCCLILEGFALRYKLMDGGKRQIFSFHIAGDIPDLHSLHLEVMDHNIGTLAGSRVAFIPHDAMRSLMANHPRVGDALWRNAFIDAALSREWMASIGRREAYGRIAHLMCELFLRLRTIGLADGSSFEMPITQEDLGDALGLSSVHVNRTLQELRGNGLVSWTRGCWTVVDWEALKKAAEFDATYLHLRDPARQAGTKVLSPAATI